MQNKINICRSNQPRNKFKNKDKTQKVNKLINFVLEHDR